MERWRCKECDWLGLTSDIEIVKDPKPGSTMEWNVCPCCRSAESFVNICDEPYCQKEAGCGWPDEHGIYRRTCYEHSMFNKRPLDTRGTKGENPA